MAEARPPMDLRDAPYTEPQERRPRVRLNSGAWNPLVDPTEVNAGNPGVGESAEYELHDGPVGVQLRVEPARRSNPLIESVADWEAGSQISPLFIWSSDGLFHMLYECGAAGTCYATSADGYDWERPDVGEVEFNGSTRNNILAHGIKGATGVFIDPHGPPEERFKAMGGKMGWFDPETCDKVEGEEVGRRLKAQEDGGPGYAGPRVEIWGRTLGWVSADGRHWEPLPEPQAPRPVNGGYSVRWDADNGEYIAYLQIMGNTAESMPGIGTGRIEEESQRRTIGFSRTRDFRNWPAPRLILAPDGQEDLDISFYGANYFPYPGRTDLHTMIIPIFHQVTDHCDTQIAFSRDGIFWTRPERRSIHTVGPRGAADDGQVHTWRNGMVELPDGLWAVPHNGVSNIHNAPEDYTHQHFAPHPPRQIHYALWPPHRFCGVEAPTEGRFTIPTIYRHGDRLRLNYRCELGGWIKLELVQKVPSLARPDPAPIAGFSFAACDRLMGDELDRVVTWNGRSDISQIGSIVAIRVQMFKAKLFAYRV